MKSHFSEEDETATSSRDTADDHCWRDHRVGSAHVVGEVEVLLLVALVLVVLGANWAAYETPTAASLAMSQQRPLPFQSYRPITPRQQLANGED